MAADLQSGRSPDALTSNEALLQWAAQNNITIDGIAPANLSSGGRGVVAQRKLHTGEELIRIPSELLITADSDSSFLAQHLHQIRKCSVHGQIAAKFMLLLLDPDHALNAWAGILPSQQEITSCMPVFWPERCQEKLPEAAKSMLQKQMDKMNGDLAQASKSYLRALSKQYQKTIDELADVYRYAWMLVNSRCFYWDYEYPLFTAAANGDQKYSLESAKKQRTRKRVYGRDRDDCMTLCPVIDCFNHSDSESCQVTYTLKGFSVKCSRDCEPGEELYITYGKHSNDYLLVEYGFLLKNNTADHTSLDFLMLNMPRGAPGLVLLQSELLNENGFLGNYTISRSGVCHRTQCALRTRIMQPDRWKQFLADAEEDEAEREKGDKELSGALHMLLGFCEAGVLLAKDLKLPKTMKMDEAVLAGIRDTLYRRWNEINEMAEECLQKLGDEPRSLPGGLD